MHPVMYWHLLRPPAEPAPLADEGPDGGYGVALGPLGPVRPLVADPVPDHGVLKGY
jgi:hypothetical protein